MESWLDEALGDYFDVPKTCVRCGEILSFEDHTYCRGCERVIDAAIDRAYRAEQAERDARNEG